MLGDFFPSDIDSISNRFFENQPNKICRHLSEKESKGRFLKSENLQTTVTKEKERRKRKGEEKERRRGEKKQWLHS